MGAPADSRGEIAFAVLTRRHFGLVAAWLAEPLVRRWWNQDPSTAAVEELFGPSVDGDDPTEVFVASLGSHPFGLIQRYAIAAYPEYVEELAPICAVPRGALSIDYLVGEPDARHRGLGGAMIAVLVAKGWRRHPDAHDVIVPVAAGNRASWRALERAGFTRIAEGPLTPDNPSDPPDHVVYRAERPGWRELDAGLSAAGPRTRFSAEARTTRGQPTSVTDEASRTSPTTPPLPSLGP